MFYGMFYAIGLPPAGRLTPALQSTCWLQSCLMSFNQLRPNLWPDDRPVEGRLPPSPRPWFTFPPKKLFNTCPALPPFELMLTKKKSTKPRRSPLTPSSRNAARKPIYTMGSITWSPALKLLSPAAFSLSLSTEKMLTDCPCAAAACWLELSLFRIPPWKSLPNIKKDQKSERMYRWKLRILETFVTATGTVAYVLDFNSKWILAFHLQWLKATGLKILGHGVSIV